jgi:Protein of unknown function (DUF1192)
MTDLSALSAGELQESIAAHQQEVQRREAMDQAERQAQFAAQLDEVREGKRPMRDEHIPYLTPREVETCVNRGQVPGIAPDRRLRRGQ